MKRIFKPTGNPKTSVKRWVWIKGRGLSVEYKDGYKMKSEYTLPELLNIEPIIEER